MELARVVSFDGVGQDQVEQMRQRLGEGRPEGVPATEIVMLFDPEAESSRVILFFADEDDYDRADATLRAMSADETPGRRTSIERFEVAVRATALTGHEEERAMDLYAILRRGGWRSGADLEAAAARSTQVSDEQMADDVRWIRSYVLDEGGGTLGTVCIYEASSPGAIREHASRADLPVDEVIPVADTVVVRPDPEPAHP